MSTTQETLELVHHHPGRLRVRADVFRGDEALAGRVREAVVGLLGVTRVSHSTRTGSLLIEYEPGHGDPERILEALATVAGVCPIPEGALARARTPALLAVGAIQELNAVASELTGHKADLRTLVPAGLAALSAYSFATSGEPRLPRWDNLLWWSYSVFLVHHRSEIDALAEERRLARLEPQATADAAQPVGPPIPT